MSATLIDALYCPALRNNSKLITAACWPNGVYICVTVLDKTPDIIQGPPPNVGYYQVSCNCKIQIQFTRQDVSQYVARLASTRIITGHHSFMINLVLNYLHPAQATQALEE